MSDLRLIQSFTFSRDVETTAGLDGLLLTVAGTSDTERLSRLAAAVSLPLMVNTKAEGVAELEALAAAGAASVVIEGAALHDPDLITAAARALGSDAVVLAITAAPESEDWRVMDNGVATEWDAVTWARVAEAQGIGELIVLVGSLQGGGAFDLELLRAVREAVKVPVIARGDPRGVEDVFDAAMIGGAHGVILESLPMADGSGVAGIREYLAERGFS